MDKDNKIMKNIAWGVSALIGFIIAERIYDKSIKAIDKHEEILEIECNEITE